LVGYNLPRLTGFSTVQANLPATIDNTGVEFVCNTMNIRTKEFTWTSAFNISAPKNKLASYPGLESSPYAYSYVVGASLFSHFVYKFNGVDPQTGIYQFASKAGNGPPSAPRDWIFSQAITQQFYGGFQNSFAFKGFQLEILVQFVKQRGYSYLNSFGLQPGFFNSNQPEVVLSRWQKPGDITTIQKFSTLSNAYTAYQNFIAPSDATVSDASFARLKNLSFSYQLPSGWQKKAHLHQARVYVQCQNLLTITNYLGMDPETGGLSLPPLRTITAGFQTTF